MVNAVISCCCHNSALVVTCFIYRKIVIVVHSIGLELLINGAIYVVVPNAIFLVAYYKLAEFNSTKKMMLGILNRYAKKKN